MTLNNSTITGKNAYTSYGGGIFNYLLFGATLTGAVAGPGGNVYNNAPDGIDNF